MSQYSQTDIPEPFHMPLCGQHDLSEITVTELQALYTSGSLTCVQVVKFYHERIRRTNPYLECVIEVNPDAVEIARQLDEERSAGGIRGPLHGIPVLVKDNIATADRMQTTAGSWALLGSTVPRSAHVISLLLTHGALLLGHTNMDEWACMRSRTYSLGYSARGGQCRNAFDLCRESKGSSTGSAVAVTANLCVLALGTETDTSVIWPAMASGVVGIKPTVGLTSRCGVVPISTTQDTVGVMGRCVADAAMGLDGIVGVDGGDGATLVEGRWQEGCYAGFLATRDKLRGRRFGVPGKRFWDCAPLGQRKVVEEVLQWIRAAGAEVVRVEMPCAEERVREDGEWDWERGDPSKSEITVCEVECYNAINAYLSELSNTPIKTFEDIIRFNNDNTGTEGGIPNTHRAWPSGQDAFESIAARKGRKDSTYYAALAHTQQQTRGNGIDAALKYTTQDGTTDQLDALLFCDIKATGQQIAAQAGYPIITLPVGVDADGMPVGLTLQHTAWREGALIRWASAIEDLVRNKRGGEGRARPTFKNHLAKNLPIEPCWRL